MGINTSEFWPTLREMLTKAKTMPPDKASRMMVKFLDDYRGGWPWIEEDIARDAELRSLFERALEV